MCRSFFNITALFTKSLTILSICLLVLLFLPSCSDNEVASVDTEEEIESPNEITDFTVRTDGFRYTVFTDGESRFVKGKRRGMGIVASIHDAEDKLLFEITAETDGHSLIVSERTETDRLWIKQTETTSEVEEHYNLNGHQLIVKYPKLDEVTMASSYNNYLRGNYDAIHPELLQAILEFEDFYQMDNTLHWNSDAEILVSTLLSKEIYDQAVCGALNKYGSDDLMLKSRKYMDAWCGGVTIGTTIKCWIGGFANVFCIMGTIIALACAFFQLWTVFLPW